MTSMTQHEKDELILVTGGTGHLGRDIVGRDIVGRLLAQGKRVRVRLASPSCGR